ncbi:histidine phosphatase family protein [Dictyobacter vulcani]|nr:histidine phosphatase family protein [Dictyobacter vulcani]
MYFIRHGEAMSAVDGFVGDGGLSPLGILQAQRLRDRLAATKEIAADILIASTFPRALQTAQIIAPALGLPLQLDDEIQELRPGEAEGLPIEIFWERFGKPNYETMPFRPIAPAGESWAQFMLRVRTALDRIVRVHEGKTIVLVCHGGVIDGSFHSFFHMDEWELPPTRFSTRNTAITHWKKESEGNTRERWQLIKHNDGFHLQDIGTPTRIPWEQLSTQPASDADRPSIPVPTTKYEEEK